MGLSFETLIDLCNILQKMEEPEGTHLSQTFIELFLHCNFSNATISIIRYSNLKLIEFYK